MSSSKVTYRGLAETTCSIKSRQVLTLNRAAAQSERLVFAGLKLLIKHSFVFL